MKKIFMTLAAVAIAASVNAQMYVGGSLGFDYQNNKTEVSAAGATTTSELGTTNFSILPEFGYKIDDQMAIGVAFGYSYTSAETGKNPDTKDKTSRFEFNPYFRYTFLQMGSFSVFADAQVGFYTGKTTSETASGAGVVSVDYPKVSGFSFAIRPGIAYQANDALSFVAKLGNGLGYWSDKTETSNTTTNTVSKFGLNFDTLGLQFGMYYNF